MPIYDNKITAHNRGKIRASVLLRPATNLTGLLEYRNELPRRLLLPSIISLKEK